MLKKENPSKVSDITSRLVSIEGPQGLRIMAYIDEGDEEVWNERFVILAPRYGETKKNNLQLSYFLVANGFKVLRFDQTNHIGESDGSIDKFTLSSGAEDIVSVVDYVDRYFEPAEIILITLSLSTRCGIRACSIDKRIDRFGSIVGMVNMDKTLQSIYQRDFFGELSRGTDWRLVDILGFEIDGVNFYEDLRSSNMIDIEGTVEDISKVKIPILNLYAENDLWIDRKDLEKAFAPSKMSKLIEIPGVGHEINESSAAVHFAFNMLLDFCNQGLRNMGQIFQPDRKRLLDQNRYERERLRDILQFSDQEDEFWNKYLGKFGVIEEAHYYIAYFRKMADLLGSFHANDVILDAGCGNGFYGLSILRTLILDKTSQRELPKPLHYCGIDLTSSGLEKSYLRQVDEISKLNQESIKEFGYIGLSYRKIDFDQLRSESGKGLPFNDNAISKICCSLVLSYLKDPFELMREFMRILKNGGVAVISSMKPGCDMTVLYHDYVLQEQSAQEIDNRASQLLSAAGKIKLKNESGIYRFFSETELVSLAKEAGFKKIKSFRSLGDQANIIRIAK